MITIIVGTNADTGNTAAIANVYADYLKEKGREFQFLNLKDMPSDIIAPDMYYNRKPSFEKFQEQYLFPTQKYIIVIPEYNGGIPGIFKLMMDASDITKAWWGKKACITGVASGRAGNLRGLDTLTNILHYLRVDVLKNKLPISRVDDLVVDGVVSDQYTRGVIQEQLDQFLSF